MHDLSYYGAKGVKMLKEATPKDTGKTANAWYYSIRNGRLTFKNRNGPVVELICNGYNNHGTWVPGNDFVTPVLRELFEEMMEDRIRDAERISGEYLRSLRRRGWS